MRRKRCSRPPPAMAPKRHHMIYEKICLRSNNSTRRVNILSNTFSAWFPFDWRVCDRCYQTRSSDRRYSRVIVENIEPRLRCSHRARLIERAKTSSALDTCARYFHILRMLKIKRNTSPPRVARLRARIRDQPTRHETRVSSSKVAILELSSSAFSKRQSLRNFSRHARATARIANRRYRQSLQLL